MGIRFPFQLAFIAFNIIQIEKKIKDLFKKKKNPKETI